MTQFFRLTSTLGTVLIGSAATLNLTASAATLGEFQLSGGTLIPFTTATDVSLSRDGIDLNFDPEPITPIAITNATGIFTGFDTGNIQDITSFGLQIEVENAFIDLGNANIAPGITTLPNASLTDKVNVFNLSEASYNLSQSGANVVFDVNLLGKFIIEGITYNGSGNLTFQSNNTTVAEIQAILGSGGSVDNMTFSGGLFTTAVPEPLTILGTATAISFGASFKRKLTKSQKK